MASHHSQSAIASTAFSDDPSRQVEPIFKGQILCLPIVLMRGFMVVEIPNLQ